MRVGVEETIQDKLVPMDTPYRAAQLDGVECRKGLPVLQGCGAQTPDREVVHCNAHVQGGARGGHARLQDLDRVHFLNGHGADFCCPLGLLRVSGCLRHLRLGGRWGLLQGLWFRVADGNGLLRNSRHNVIHARAGNVAESLRHSHDAIEEGVAWYVGHDQHHGGAELPHRLWDEHVRKGLLHVGVDALQRLCLCLKVQLVVKVPPCLTHLLQLRAVEQTDDEGHTAEVRVNALRHLRVLHLDDDIAPILCQTGAVDLADACSA
mmetsp:Transcript_74801/g.232072  ORF Transcript_74801/g.232072 Transcript_74801/m.232072 type:complete len:264 (+) Transcript_74801:189-980(+)